MSKRTTRREERLKEIESEGESSFEEDSESVGRRKNNAKKTRNESSLSVLTTKFLELLSESENGTIDLNEAVYQLNVQKRRIYDITNVLEGIGYIKKSQKNKIQMINQEDDQGLDKQLEQLQREMKELEEQERKCDEKTLLLEKELEKIMNDPEQMRYAYITEADIQSLMSNNKIRTPYVLVEASENTKIDYYIPSNRELNDVDSDIENSTFKQVGENNEENQYQILIDSKDPINLYFATDDPQRK